MRRTCLTRVTISLFAFATAAASAALFSWSGAGGDGLWSTPANWLVGGAPPAAAPAAGDDIVLPSAAAPTTTVMDVDLAGGRFNSLSVAQTQPGVRQTLSLQQNLLLSSLPALSVSGGGLLDLDLGAARMDWRTSATTVAGALAIPANTSVLLNGGRLGAPAADGGIWGGGSLTFQPGSALSGVGTVNPSYGTLALQDGATLTVGAGTLGIEYNYVYGNQFIWNGQIQGNGTSSVLFLAGPTGAQRFAGTPAPGANAAVSGLKELWVGVSDTGAYTFGRFTDPARIDLAHTQFAVDAHTWLWKWDWEAMTTLAALQPDPDAAFKLGSYYEAAPWAGAYGRLKLVDTSGAPGTHFAYIGQLLNLHGNGAAGYGIDLNDIALLTDMTEAQLQAFVAAGYVFNSGTLGAPLVKPLEAASRTFWYLAPAGVVIPEPGALALAAAAVLLAWRRRR